MSRFALAAVLFAATPAWAQARYFSELADVPMPAGFTETDTAVGFGGDQGRLVMAEAQGEASPSQVRAFYIESLPALGWSISPAGDGVLVFLRGRERLTMSLASNAARTRLHAQLVVRPASMD